MIAKPCNTTESVGGLWCGSQDSKKGMRFYHEYFDLWFDWDHLENARYFGLVKWINDKLLCTIIRMTVTSIYKHHYIDEQELHEKINSRLLNLIHIQYLAHGKTL